MTEFTPADPGYQARVRASYARQTIMATIGAQLTQVAPGQVEIVLPYRTDLCQQHGFFHAGIVATVVDSACGYAAFSLMPADAAVLTVEFKTNFMAPAAGERLLARGVVKKPGRTITVCTGDVYALHNGREKLVATMLATVMAVFGRGDVRG